MRVHLACGIMIACAVPLVAAGQTSAPTKATGTKPISLSGCVVRGETAPDQYTLADEKGTTYRLTGTDVRDYIGRRVQIVGGVVASRKLTIAGGLRPSANAAAQAGAIDPAQAATAAASGSAGPGTVQLPEFRVKSVRPVAGGCTH
jgi:hypothetical protein